MDDNSLPIVYVFNMLEDVIAFADWLPEDKRKLEIEQCAKLYTGRELISLLAQYRDRDAIYFVTPFQMDEAYVDYACKLMDVDKNKLHLIAPNETFEDHQGRVSEDLLRKENAIKELDKLERFQITSYCVSDSFYQLFEHFGDKVFGTDVTPRADWENVKRLGTKPGIRELVEKLNDENIIMSPGIIFKYGESNLEQVIDYAAKKLEYEGAVIKIEKGHGGVGVEIVTLDEIKSINFEERKIYLRERLKADYWNHFDIVVEKQIDIDSSIVRDPNVEVRINPDGSVEVLYVCGMRVVDEQYFVGVEFGKGVMDEETERKLRYIGETIGKEYSNLGYRGNFEFDCFYDKTGKLHVTESNIRRTGGTFAYNFAIAKFGDDYLNHYYLTSSIDEPLVYGYTFTEINDLLIKEKINFSENSGVVLTSPDGYGLGNLSYMIVADSRDKANELEKKLYNAIKQLK